MTPTRPALRWHGGKWLLAPWIIRFFPKHRWERHEREALADGARKRTEVAWLNPACAMRLRAERLPLLEAS